MRPWKGMKQKEKAYPDLEERLILTLLWTSEAEVTTMVLKSNEDKIKFVKKKKPIYINKLSLK